MSDAEKRKVDEDIWGIAENCLSIGHDILRLKAVADAIQAERVAAADRVMQLERQLAEARRMARVLAVAELDGLDAAGPTYEDDLRKAHGFRP